MEFDTLALNSGSQNACQDNCHLDSVGGKCCTLCLCSPSVSAVEPGIFHFGTFLLIMLLHCSYHKNFLDLYTVLIQGKLYNSENNTEMHELMGSILLNIARRVSFLF